MHSPEFVYSQPGVRVRNPESVSTARSPCAPRSVVQGQGFCVHNRFLEVTVPKAPSVSLTKLIEATRLHPRTGLSLGVPPVTVPYGALIEPLGPDRDRERFTYLGELYECKRDLFLSATGGAKGTAKPPGGPEPAPEVEDEPEPAKPSGPRLEWDRVHSSTYSVTRAAIPGGWLVALNGNGLTFVPDEKHQWDGGSAE